VLAADHQLRVVDQVHAEQEGAEARVEQPQRLVLAAEEHEQDAEDEQHDGRRHQDAAHRREVDLRLEGEHRQREAQYRAYAHRQQHLSRKTHRLIKMNHSFHL